jgi:glycogen phosphorylase
MSTVSNLYGIPASSPEVMKIEGFDNLAALALDMRWSWNHNADELWQQLAPALWAQTHNPWLVVQSVSGDMVRRLLMSPGFKERLDDIERRKEDEDARAGWFKTTYPDSALKHVAYFSMEFMLGESLPIYVGGLGNVAGDQLKAASDLDVPVTGIGLLYQRGYFRQSFNEWGDQQAANPFNDPGQLPVKPLRLPNGEWVRVEITLLGRPLWLRAWQVQTGRSRLFLLDSNDAANAPEYREITAEVYGGGMETRIQQEIVLGIGGWRLLQIMGISPEVCHLNEGHAAFVVLERAYHMMQELNVNFETALAITRAGNLFTTHTAVAAGFDHFDPWLVNKYLGPYASDKLGISMHDLMALGRQDANNEQEGFNMAYLAVHGSRGINGVSKLHGQVSRHLFEPLFNRWPTEEVPIGHVTNGVHVPTWESEPADGIWAAAVGRDRWKGPTESFAEQIQKVEDYKLWEMRNAARAALLNYVKESSGNVFSPAVLTIGFARRFVPYKRPDLLLMDEDRLVRLLTNYHQPVQLVIAGKAPPFDQSGKDLIKRWIQFIKRTNLGQHVVFLQDYDMLMAAHLVGGMDVWLNTPQRPWEASGTSGMKVLVNGGVNLSELDGWWVEAYTPEVGWALGDGLEHGYDPALDKQESEALFDLLEKQVIPEFYERNADGIPVTWIKRVRNSMATLTSDFSAGRTVREYTENYYLPAAAAYLSRAAHSGDLGRRIVQGKQALETRWAQLKFGALKVSEHSLGNTHTEYDIEVTVFLDGLDPNTVAVELIAGAVNGGGLFRLEMKLAEENEEGWIRYTASVPASRPAADYTPRIIAKSEVISVPLEFARILWQH